MKRVALGCRRISLSAAARLGRPRFYTLRKATLLFLTIICVRMHADESDSWVANPMGPMQSPAGIVTIRYPFTPREGHVRYSALVQAAHSFNASVHRSKAPGSTRREHPRDTL